MINLVMLWHFGNAELAKPFSILTGEACLHDKGMRPSPVDVMHICPGGFS